MSRRLDSRTAEAKRYRRLYSTSRWRAIRAHQLNARPLCEMCEKQGRVTAAEIVDHVTPHKGDEALFFGGPFTSLCKPHHDSTKQGEERRGYSGEVDATGWPIDRRHPSNRRQPGS